MSWMFNAAKFQIYKSTLSWNLNKKVMSHTLGKLHRRPKQIYQARWGNFEFKHERNFCKIIRLDMEPL